MQGFDHERVTVEVILKPGALAVGGCRPGLAPGGKAYQCMPREAKETPPSSGEAWEISWAAVPVSFNSKEFIWE